MKQGEEGLFVLSKQSSLTLDGLKQKIAKMYSQIFVEIINVIVVK
jgi:hypothetical protein